MSKPHWIGVDVGGTKILAGLFDDDLTLVSKEKEPTPVADGPKGVFAAIKRAVDKVLEEGHLSHSDVKGLGLAIPGQIAPNSTRVRFAPNLDWRDVDVSHYLPDSWKQWSVVLENDVRMGTYGEFTRGAAKGSRHVLGIFVGTGVGGGLILDGKLHTGFLGHAGEIGHTVINWRKGTTVEEVAGRKYQMKRAKDILDDAPKRVRKEWKDVDLAKVKSSQLADFYQKDDPVAVALIDDAARAVGAAVGSAINLLSPEVIVLGGGITEALKETFTERVWEFAGRYVLPGAADGVRCVVAALGDYAGATGAAAYAKAEAK
ncbi:MAG TPA: ROK family protein [Fimbriiglobus sp.]|jgi:glucokinase